MGIRKYHSMRLVLNESGNECIVPLQIHNQWKTCPLVLKSVQPVNNENLEESGGESDNDNPWDYWDP